MLLLRKRRKKKKKKQKQHTHFPFLFEQVLVLLVISVACAEVALEPLPYALDALAPFISATTMETHHGAHLAGYVKKTNALLSASSPSSLVEIIRASAPAHGPLFLNSAQVFNHNFFFRSLAPQPPRYPPEPLWTEIQKRFGDMDGLKAELKAKGLGQFGSGWVWLVKLPKGSLQVLSTSNAQTPIVDPQVSFFHVW
jgi:Fe-Mn family superoxide dismutase